MLDSYLLHIIKLYCSTNIIKHTLFNMVLFNNIWIYIYKRKNTITIIVLSYEYYFECIYVNKTLIKSLIYTSDNSTHSLTQHENSVPSMLSYRALTVLHYVTNSRFKKNI